MRSTDDQLREIMKRADQVKATKASKKAAVSYALSACACIALLVVTSLHIPGLSQGETAETQGHYGSLMLNTSFMSYVVIGTLAFLLGICLTLLCMHIVEQRKKERGR